MLYQPIGGGINLVLTQTGLYPHVIDWLGQSSTAMPAVIIASVWRGFPLWFVSILAALQSIPRELYEARGSMVRTSGSSSGTSRCPASARFSS